MPEDSTVGALAHTLERRHAGLSGLLTHGRVAVNAEFADENTALHEGDEVAFMPPMSGGQEGCEIGRRRAD